MTRLDASRNQPAAIPQISESGIFRQRHGQLHQFKILFRRIAGGALVLLQAIKGSTGRNVVWRIPIPLVVHCETVLALVNWQHSICGASSSLLLWVCCVSHQFRLALQLVVVLLLFNCRALGTTKGYRGYSTWGLRSFFDAGNSLPARSYSAGKYTYTQGWTG